ncbi:transposase family protein [Geobacter argillaceus]|uniref:Transposase IS204/IS1001/IS1096/IS1165 family protein n=1 Tax=Geobacter argillaceus TaxID=345631 RepID=A0A562W8G2_9BACT|nr:transposase family protein [Geobacter argillaceus]TWJ26492.1 transposase IS204/IS1001/IS1096/IS1165 family protein [Geobacter argillaceus]
MDHTGIFAATLGLSQPWQIDRISFVDEIGRVDLFLTCSSGARFSCPVCGQDAQVRDIREELWHHVDFFRYAAYLHASVPLIDCPAGCGISTVSVPWSRPGSRFVLLGSKSRPSRVPGTTANDTDTTG